MFVDEATVYLRAGDGGAGVVSFHKIRGKPRGKPEGGPGGSGGDVVVMADVSVSTLLDFKRRPHRRAGAGTHGSGDHRHGRNGEDLVLRVPPGTVVRDETGTILADLARDGQSFVVVQGGRGGRGNAGLVSPRNVVPNFAEQGEYGEEVTVLLELKLVADVAIIGFPNAGKSTFIAAVSAAKPKIADYPFTTLTPNLGLVDLAGRDLVLADIPGLIEGAAEGRGLGHEFLRHAERARALLVLVDPSPLQERSVVEQYDILINELERHGGQLSERPRVVAVSKADLPESAEAASSLEGRGLDVFLVSSATNSGLEPVLFAVADAAELAERLAPEGEGYVLHRPAPAGFEIFRDEDRWVVTGKLAERAVALDDLTKPEAADFAARRLAIAGVDDALRQAGAKPGDDVQIGEIVFEFSEEFADSGDDG